MDYFYFRAAHSHTNHNNFEINLTFFNFDNWPIVVVLQVVKYLLEKAVLISPIIQPFTNSAYRKKLWQGTDMIAVIGRGEIAFGWLVYSSMAWQNTPYS